MGNNLVQFETRREDWETPQELFDRINKVFDFQWDVCASPENSKVGKGKHWDSELDALVCRWLPWGGPFWMNPPYGREIWKWVKKAHEESVKGATIVALLPASVGTKWWREWIADNGHEVTILTGRITFVGAPGPAAFESAIVVFRPRLPQYMDVK